MVYGSSPIHSDDEIGSPPPKDLGFFGARPNLTSLGQEDGNRSPPPKRTRKGTIGAEGGPNMTEHNSVQQQSTRKSSASK